MRGEVFQRRNRVARKWITPAHAGRSTLPVTQSELARDHPRACGEKMTDGENRSALIGSPPRMRGEAPKGAPSRVHIRITPAHAGRSGQHCDSCQEHRDHPRACGEKSVIAMLEDAKVGSPPRMRGEAPMVSRKRLTSRITPAHAGRSYQNTSPLNLRQDHPRACGEKFVASCPTMETTGSPPRMRGED